MDKKLRAVAERHGIPLELLVDTISLERERVVLQKRRLVPVIIDLVERCAEEQGDGKPSGASDGD